MSGFPANFSEDVGETEDDIQIGIERATARLKRPLTKDEIKWIRLSFTDPDAAQEFSKKHPGLLE